MGETMNGIEDLLRPIGNHQSVLACGDVTEDCAVTELNVLEAKAGDECFVDSDFFQGGLVKSQLLNQAQYSGYCLPISKRTLI